MVGFAWLSFHFVVFRRTPSPRSIYVRISSRCMRTHSPICMRCRSLCTLSRKSASRRKKIKAGHALEYQQRGLAVPRFDVVCLLSSFSSDA